MTRESKEEGRSLLVKQEELFKSQHPFIQLRSSFRGFENRLTEMMITESLVQCLGYTVESFVSTVLTEGLPQ